MSKSFSNISSRAYILKNLAYAWQDGKTIQQMERIVWDSDSNAWYKWNSTTNMYASENGHRIKWTITDDVFQFLSE